MATRTAHDALSRDRIVDTAIEMLDAGGESGLTFRALSTRLKTGAGAIYWHVANKDELLAAATGAVLADVLRGDEADTTPQDAIRAIALGMFDAIDGHPWIGGQLAGLASRSASLRIIERIGQQVQAMGMPAGQRFFAASALYSFILGVAGQNAANARAREHGTSRAETLGAEAQLWANLDAAEFPFLRGVAAQLGDHDDREQFLAGIDLILAGIGIAR
ncbi:TetR family transcriptional regulator [Actinoplanes sichuanensis]|uniref:TetR family transcriptional regulator n=1 Tax=Actinoplanes sichuanensis TaxID=512349 RepID=A0ABW4AV17_9ACTN|nr:TetR/AcrR family transcriptional regulator C-terminal domain-containing protein [Actinoplanes sichuanensis]BEL04661.1 TetR family transcriptional regulator [Actinoplanes sichuanensis]